MFGDGNPHSITEAIVHVMQNVELHIIRRFIPPPSHAARFRDDASTASYLTRAVWNNWKRKGILLCRGEIGILNADRISRRYKYNGEVRTLAEWARYLEVDFHKLWNRGRRNVARGASRQEAFERAIASLDEREPVMT